MSIGDHVPSASHPAMTQRARLVHMSTLAVAGVFLLVEATRQWFFLDEWDFLAYRGVHVRGREGIFAPHNEHWTTIPILIWRGLFNVVGVRDYWLYAIPLIIVHLAVVHLLWRLLLRHGVDPWTATLLVATFAVLAVGSENVTRAFQITFVGSVAFGLLAIDAVERDRFWIPPLWSVCALMCSNIGVPMVFACVLVALARRRLKAAAWAALPPAAVFVVWYLLIGHIGTYTSTDVANLSVGGLVSYVWTGMTTSIGGLFTLSPQLGAVLVVVLAGAAVVRRNVPAALALTALVFYAFVGVGRLQYGSSQAIASRYSYVAVALCLPLIGQLVSILVRWRNLRPVITVGLILLIGANAVSLETDATLSAAAANKLGTQIKTAALLIQRGETFPGQLTSSSPIGPPNAPGVSALTVLIRHGQFPVPASVPLHFVRAEQAMLGVFMSPRPGYRGGLTFNDPTLPRCVTVNPLRSVLVKLPASGSIRLTVEHLIFDVTMKVTFPPAPHASSTSVVVPVTGVWLNISAGGYRSAFISSSTEVRVCEAT